MITQEIKAPWIITYDDVNEIVELYADFSIRKFDLTYSAANKGSASELMIFSDINCCPNSEQLKDNNITINLRK